MNKEIRVLGRLISKENLEKYTGDEFKKPIFVNNEYDNVVVVEPISDLSEYFEGKQFGYCTAWRLNNKYRNMRVEEIENDLKTMEPAKRIPFMRLTNLDFINPEDFSLEDWNEALKALFPLMTKSLTKKDAHKILISYLESNK